MSLVVSLQKIHSHLQQLDVPDILNQNRACEEIYLQPKNIKKIYLENLLQIQSNFFQCFFDRPNKFFL